MNIIGTFANMLAVKNDPIEDKTFSDFLYEVKENAFNAFENQDYQFEALVGKLGIQVTPTRNPLFDVVLNLYSVEPEEEEKTPAADENPGLTLEPYDTQWNASKYDLLMRVREIQGAVTMSLEYAVGLFKPAAIEKMGRYFLELLEQALENKESKLKELTIPYDYLLVQPSQKHEDLEFVF